MSSLVAFDQNGAVGPAMTLIYNSEYFSKNGILSLADLLKANFMKLAHLKPKGKKLFCTFVQEKNQLQLPISPTEIIGTKFFQSMQKSEPLPSYHEKILEFIVPRMLNTTQEHIPQADIKTEEAQKVKEWLARFIESYMTEDQIGKLCQLQESSPEEIMEERIKIGKEIYEAAKTKQFTEKDLDVVIDVSRVALEHLKKADHPSLTLNLTGKYFILFSMNKKNPLALGEDVLQKLSEIFRKKCFN